jgi:hypothetical protein
MELPVLIKQEEAQQQAAQQQQETPGARLATSLAGLEVREEELDEDTPDEEQDEAEEATLHLVLVYETIKRSLIRLASKVHVACWHRRAQALARTSAPARQPAPSLGSRQRPALRAPRPARLRLVIQ